MRANVSQKLSACLLLVAGMAAATAGCASAAHTGKTNNVGLVQIKVSQYRGDVVTPARRKPHIVLTDTSGQRYDFLKGTSGRVTLLFFGYTHCPDECPLTMSDAAIALRELTPAEQAKIRVVFVTVDPARDTGPVLKHWLDQFDPAFIGLTGTVRAIQAAANAAGIPVGNPVRQPDGSYQLDHGTEILAFSTDNRAHLAFFPSTSPNNMSHDLRLLVAGRYP
jgi:protein SCO1